MTPKHRRYWRFVRPPRGVDVRRVVALITLGIGIPRTEPFHTLATYWPLRLGEPQAYGVTFSVIGIALLITCYRGRLAWPGRLVAATAFVAHFTLAIDVGAASTVSAITELIIAYALLGEIIAHEH